MSRYRDNDLRIKIIAHNQIIPLYYPVDYIVLPFCCTLITYLIVVAIPFILSFVLNDRLEINNRCIDVKETQCYLKPQIMHIYEDRSAMFHIDDQGFSTWAMN